MSHSLFRIPHRKACGVHNAWGLHFTLCTKTPELGEVVKPPARRPTRTWRSCPRRRAARRVPAAGPRASAQPHAPRTHVSPRGAKRPGPASPDRLCHRFPRCPQRPGACPSLRWTQAPSRPPKDDPSRPGARARQALWTLRRQATAVCTRSSEAGPSESLTASSHDRGRSWGSYPALGERQHCSASRACGSNAPFARGKDMQRARYPDSPRGTAVPLGSRVALTLHTSFY